MLKINNNTKLDIDCVNSIPSLPSKKLKEFTNPTTLKIVNKKVFIS